MGICLPSWFGVPSLRMNGDVSFLALGNKGCLVIKSNMVIQGYIISNLILYKVLQSKH